MYSDINASGGECDEHKKSTLQNILSFDIEDWFQSTFDLNHPITDRVKANTETLLAVLGDFQARATFFVQGMVAKKFPDLLFAIDGAGHELATHGYSHQPVNRMTKEQFRDELKRSMDLISTVVGKEVIGFRAPDFSIDEESFWAFGVMRECGIRYDSSIFPVRTSRYGIDGFSTTPIYMNEFDVFEIPMSTVPVFGRLVPIGGGGYFRLLPFPITNYFIRKMNCQDTRCITYFHPYELNANDFDGEHVPFPIRMHQGLFRSRVKARIRLLLKSYRFIACDTLFLEELHERENLL